MFNSKADPVRDTHLYFTATQTLAAIRQGDWKLFLEAPPNGQGKKGAAKKNDDVARSGPALYNLTTDPGETKDVVADHPEIVAKLKAEAERRKGEIDEHRRPAGKLSAAD